GLAVLLHPRDQVDQPVDFLVGYGAPIGPPCEVRHDLPDGRGVPWGLGGDVPEYLLDRLLRRAFRLPVRPDHVEVHDEKGHRPPGCWRPWPWPSRVSAPCRPRGVPRTSGGW